MKSTIPIVSTPLQKARHRSDVASLAAFSAAEVYKRAPTQALYDYIEEQKAAMEQADAEVAGLL